MVEYHKSNVVKVDPLIRLNFVKDNIGIEIIREVIIESLNSNFQSRNKFKQLVWKGGGSYARDVFLRFSQGVLLKLGLTLTGYHFTLDLW